MTRRLPLLPVALLCAVAFAVSLTGCAGTQTAGPASGNSGGPEMDAPALVFGDVKTLLADAFLPLLPTADADASSWEAFVEGSDAHGTLAIPYDADRSLLVELAERARAEDRPGAPTEAQIARVRRWIETGAQSDGGAVPYADAERLLYVANEAGALVTIIDADAQQVVRTVDLTERGFGPGCKPHDTAVGPDGEYWYVSLIGANRVLKFDRNNEIVKRLTFEAPGLMKLDPTSGRLFVGRSMGAVNPPHSIGIAEEADAELRVVDVFFARPHALGVDPSGQQAYVASLAQNQVAGINAADGQMELTSMGGPINTLVHFAVSPDGQTLAAGGQVSGKFFFFDVDASNPLTPRVADSLQLGGQPWHPVYTPDGGHLYVPQKTADAVTVIDAATHEVEAVVRHEALIQPHGAAADPNGRFVYVTASNVDGGYTPPYGTFGGEQRGFVLAIDTATNEVAAVIPAGLDPSGLDMRP